MSAFVFMYNGGAEEILALKIANSSRVKSLFGNTTNEDLFVVKDGYVYINVSSTSTKRVYIFVVDNSGDVFNGIETVSVDLSGATKLNG